MLCGMRYTCKLPPYGVQYDLSHCPLCQLKRIGKCEIFELLKKFHLLFGAQLPRETSPPQDDQTYIIERSHQDCVTSLLQHLNFFPCAIMESSFGCLVNGKQREALSNCRLYHLFYIIFIFYPTYCIRFKKSILPHCGVV